MYAYVSGNPINFTDPTGMFFKKIFKGVKKVFKVVKKAAKIAARAYIAFKTGGASEIARLRDRLIQQGAAFAIDGLGRLIVGSRQRDDEVENITIQTKSDEEEIVSKFARFAVVLSTLPTITRNYIRAGHPQEPVVLSWLDGSRT